MNDVEYLELRPRSGIYRFNDVQVLGARIGVELNHLREKCNERARIVHDNMKLEPLTNIVVMELLKHGTSGMGARHVLVIRALVQLSVKDDRGGGWTPRMNNGSPEPMMLCLFAITDDPWFLIDGRELVGYPVLRGYFDEQVNTDDSVSIEIATDGYAERANKLSKQTILKIVGKPANSADVNSDDAHFPWRPQDFKDSERPVALKELLTWQSRQWRDAIEPTNADFIAAVFGKFYQLTPKKREFINGQAELTLHDCRSLQLTKLLNCGSTIKLAAGHWYRSTLDLLIDTDNTQNETIALPSRPTSRFVDSPGDPQSPPPFVFENVLTLGFKVPVRNPAKLREFCEAVLNIDGEKQGFKYKVASDQVVIELLNYGSMRIDGQTDRIPGLRTDDYVHQEEFLIRVLVGKVEDDSGIATEPKMFVPAILVSDAWSLIGGREVIGYPKQLASFLSSDDDATIAQDSCCQRLAAPVDEGGRSQIDEDEAFARLDDATIVKTVCVRLPYAGVDNHVADAPACATVFSVKYPRDAERQMTVVNPSDAQQSGPYNWIQSDFDESEFRRSFVREWFEMRPGRFRSIQRKQVRDWTKPGYARRATLIESESSIKRLSAGFPEGVAELTFSTDYLVDVPGKGKYRLFDALGITSTNRRSQGPNRRGNADPIARVDDGRSGNERRKLQLRSEDSLKSRVTLELTTGQWYVADCDFTLRMIDPLRDTA